MNIKIHEHKHTYNNISRETTKVRTGNWISIYCPSYIVRKGTKHDTILSKLLIAHRCTQIKEK